MSAILTVTFSPCIDKTTSVHKLEPDRKLRCGYPKLEPGGGGINVARAIKRLGGKAIAIYPAGGYTGKFFTQLLEEQQVTSLVIETQNETRENIIVLDESVNRQYRFGMPAMKVQETEWRNILTTIEKIEDARFIIASGSLPPGVPVDIFARIGAIAKKKNAKYIADTSGEALEYATYEGVFLLKPNLGELSWLIGKNFLQPGEIAGAARSIIKNGKCEVVVVSMGASGAMLVTKDLAELISAPPVKKESTVGAGDSMVAGIVMSLSKGDTIETAVQYGVACGTSATMNPGTELCRKEDADSLFRQIQLSAEIISQAGE